LFNKKFEQREEGEEGAKEEGEGDRRGGKISLAMSKIRPKNANDFCIVSVLRAGFGFGFCCRGAQNERGSIPLDVSANGELRSSRPLCCFRYPGVFIPENMIV